MPTPATSKPLFNLPAIVVLLLSQHAGTGAGLLQRAQKLQFPARSGPLYRAIDQLKKGGLIRYAGSAARRGGGKRWILTDEGRAIAAKYRRLLAVAASHFPDGF